MAKVTKKPALNSNSSFWLDKDTFNFDGGSNSITKKLKLLAYKRSISNFVKILTQKDGFVVKFSTGNDSYTDGKTVVISSKLNENNFDVTVGLALHEASHLLLTDFKALNRQAYSDACINLGSIGLEMNNTVLHTIHNIVEDRYIDDYVYTTAPGYRGYYQSLYDYYFRSKQLAQLLKMPEKRIETIDNYISQLLNIVGLEFDINCMPGMPDIIKELDLRNISRCTTTLDRLDLAARIYAIMLKYVLAAPSEPAQDSQSQDQGASSDNGEMDEMDESDSNVDKPSDENLDIQESESNSEEDKAEEKQKEPALTEAEKQVAEDVLAAAKDMINGKPSKDNAASNNLNRDIEILDKAEAELIKTDVDIYNDRSKEKIAIASVNCLLVKNLNVAIAESYMLPALLRRRISSDLQASVAQGVTLGTMLAKRMQVRNEEKNTVSNRLKSGKIFNRHIALLGTDVENIFYKVRTDKFKKSSIHISIDASGSMDGVKFNNSIMVATAIAKACTFLRGVNCIISFRSSQEKLPMMAIAYNSKRDHFSKIIELFPMLNANSSTPEGLCYEAYKKFITEEDGKDVDKYVINLSDGEPGFYIQGYMHSYGGATGMYHTRKVWNEILKSGVTGLSYFITDHEVGGYGYTRTDEMFKGMYGKEAKVIDPKNIVQLASTINNMLMSGNAMTSILSE
jgi:hypothetical protein